MKQQDKGLQEAKENLFSDFSELLNGHAEYFAQMPNDYGQEKLKKLRLIRQACMMMEEFILSGAGPVGFSFENVVPFKQNGYSVFNKTPKG